MKSILNSDTSNDTIDIYSNPKVIVKRIKADTPEEMIMSLESDVMDEAVCNTIRRTIDRYVPVYGFHRSNIYIDNEKSYNMYNNDMIFNNIEMLPIYDIPNDFDLENPEIFITNMILKESYGHLIQKKNPAYIKNNQEKRSSNKKLSQIELILNVKNKTDTFKYVTTHDAVLNVNGKPSKSYEEQDPICIIVLKPKERISLRAEANLGMSVMNAIYESTTNVIHIQQSPQKYEIRYETLGQLDSLTIFHKACLILVRKFEALYQYLKTTHPTDPTDLDIISVVIHGEEYTLGVVLTRILQKCQFIKSAGYNIKHPQIEILEIYYQLEPKAKIGKIEVLLEVVSFLIRLYKNIEQSVAKMQ